MDRGTTPVVAEMDFETGAHRALPVILANGSSLDRNSVDCKEQSVQSSGDGIVGQARSRRHPTASSNWPEITFPSIPERYYRDEILTSVMRASLNSGHA